MPIYYMFLVILLLAVLCIVTFQDSLKDSLREGLESRDQVGKIYDNYKAIDKNFEEYKVLFKSLAI